MDGKSAYQGPPTHLSRLQLQNFRGFGQKIDIPLAPLTYLVGPNSSGKSSLADAILLIAQTQPDLSGPQINVPVWSGRLVDLGSFKDVSYRHRLRRSIIIALTVSGPEITPWRSRTSVSKANPVTVQLEIAPRAKDPIGWIRSCLFIDEPSGLSFTVVWGRKQIELRFGRRSSFWKLERAADRPGRFEQWLSRELKSTPRRSHGGSANAVKRLVSFIASPFRWAFLLSQVQRVSSGRAGPKRWYPVTDARPQPAGYYDMQQTFETIEPRQLRLHARTPHRSSIRRRPAVRTAALSKMMARLEIATSIKDASLSAYHSVINLRDNITGVESNLMDVGYGASQVLPVLLASLSEAMGPLFVEQPEIHLHPKAQGIVGDLLCETSKRRQVIVETHSAHMINRARIAIAKGELNSESVIVHYVFRTKTGSKVVTIPIGPDGDFLAKWPEGFFDERYEDTMTLLKLKGEQ